MSAEKVLSKPLNMINLVVKTLNFPIPYMPLSGFFLKIRNFEVENEFSTFFEKCKNIFRVYRGGGIGTLDGHGSIHLPA